MKKYLVLLLVLFIVPVAMADDVSLVNTKAARIITVDLQGSYEVIVSALPQGQAKRLKDHVAANDAIAGMNGTFFCPAESNYNRCGADDKTSFISVVNGIATMNQNDGAGVFGFDINGNPFLNTPAKDLSNIYFGLSMKPVLLKNGVKQSIPPQPPKQAGKGRKAFICYSADKRYVKFGFIEGVNFPMLQDKLLNLGCSDAIALDQGGSSALNFKGKNIYVGRRVPNAFLVVEKGRYKAVNSYSTGSLSGITTTTVKPYGTYGNYPTYQYGVSNIKGFNTLQDLVNDLKK